MFGRLLGGGKVTATTTRPHLRNCFQEGHQGDARRLVENVSIRQDYGYQGPIEDGHMLVYGDDVMVASKILV